MSKEEEKYVNKKYDEYIRKYKKMPTWDTFIEWTKEAEKVIKKA
jgi:hypothetical protein